MPRSVLAESPGCFRFDDLSTAYSPRNAYWLCALSCLAYCRREGDQFPDVARIEQELNARGAGFDQFRGFDCNNSQAFIAAGPTRLVVAFRGTNELGDWLDNVAVLRSPPAVVCETFAGWIASDAAAPTRAPLGRVHRGFLRALHDIWGPMRRTIDQFRTTGQSVWVTGHSLGGALATLAAADLIEEDRVPVYGVYTFGQPRCGDAGFARTYGLEAGRRSFRFQNNNDIVSRLPQRFMGYRHVPQLVYIDTGKRLHTDPGFWFRFRDAAKGRWEELFAEHTDGLLDHRSGAYLAALERNIDTVPDGLR